MNYPTSLLVCTTGVMYQAFLTAGELADLHEIITYLKQKHDLPEHIAQSLMRLESSVCAESSMVRTTVLRYFFFI